MLHFFQPGISNLLWILGSFLFIFGIVALRRSIKSIDLPATELDEYEFKLHLEARDHGLQVSICLSLVLFLIGGIVAFVSRFWFDLTGLDTALFFSKLVYIQLIGVPFSVTRYLATRINRDEMVAAE
ncbi:hypothetical protein [Corynebacterium cystitidis]|uniref:Uncharacterized protein n=1 Tax=Corynebacterium cystitidis DSM 20524 TaxID=1121357 RepID=A0A1H9VQE7_9CORY|nr:hypothetical protein [Corynebacterium cystitidis]WJY82848.1 hypothetical protein CCYS_09670 [Corynebacterium cystitidis DSM 20524]SES23778.1 hypothetical protein SAMN05661109_02355 [Corynebacterium cystitidis DSM 20524]SNV69835.1 Uncharacterised protein [Corynebacterium cystitidis]